MKEASHKDYKSAFFGMFKGEYSAPMWVDKFDANSSPAVQTTIDGKEYVTASMCKASDCNSDKLFAIFTGDHKKAWGLEVTVPPAGPDALKNPKKYAAFRYYGGPDLAMRKLLMQQLEKDPYWH
jgi:hypothetical protein